MIELTIESVEGNTFFAEYIGSEFDKIEEAVISGNPILVRFDSIGVKTVIIERARRTGAILTAPIIRILYVKGHVVGD